jgi:hypothetical protein
MGAKKNETAMAWCFRGHPLLHLVGFFLFLTSHGGCGGAPSFSLKNSLSGNGIVTSNPPGINCPTTCQANFVQDSTVTLTATANTGYVFGS